MHNSLIDALAQLLYEYFPRFPKEFSSFDVIWDGADLRKPKLVASFLSTNFQWA